MKPLQVRVREGPTMKIISPLKRRALVSLEQENGLTAPDRKRRRVDHFSNFLNDDSKLAEPIPKGLSTTKPDQVDASKAEHPLKRQKTQHIQTSIQLTSIKITDLPDDPLKLLFSYLDPLQDTFRVTAVCEQFKRVYQAAVRDYFKTLVVYGVKTLEGVLASPTFAQCRLTFFSAQYEDVKFEFFKHPLFSKVATFSITPAQPLPNVAHLEAWNYFPNLPRLKQLFLPPRKFDHLHFPEQRYRKQLFPPQHGFHDSSAPLPQLFARLQAGAFPIANFPELQRVLQRMPQLKVLMTALEDETAEANPSSFQHQQLTCFYIDIDKASQTVVASLRLATQQMPHLSALFMPTWSGSELTINDVTAITTRLPQLKELAVPGHQYITWGDVHHDNNQLVTGLHSLHRFYVDTSVPQRLFIIQRQKYYSFHQNMVMFKDNSITPTPLIIKRPINASHIDLLFFRLCREHDLDTHIPSPHHPAFFKAPIHPHRGEFANQANSRSETEFAAERFYYDPNDTQIEADTNNDWHIPYTP